MQSVNPLNLKTFLRHISVAHGKVHSRNEAREDLHKRLLNLKRHGKKRKSPLAREIIKLEEAIEQVLEKESLLLNKESDTEKRIKELELEIERAKQQHVEIFEGVKDNIEKLNFKIAKNINDNVKNDLIKVHEQLNQLQESGFGTAELHEEIREFEENIRKVVEEGNVENVHLKENINDLRGKVKDLIDQKNDRDKKILHLEERIKKRTDQATIEEQIIQLEEKVLAIEEKGNFNPQIVNSLKSKINDLKSKLAQVKLDKIEKQVAGNLHETVPQDEHEMHVEHEDYHSESAFPDDMPTKNFDKLHLPHVSDARGVEFSSKGRVEADSNQLREEDSLDIPPPPPIKKKEGLFSKLFSKLKKK
jgi:chromosome segregation ATPase